MLAYCSAPPQGSGSHWEAITQSGLSEQFGEALSTTPARNLGYADPTEGGEPMGGSSCNNKLSPGRGSTEMISDGRTDANRKVLRQVRRRAPAANGPNVGTLLAGPSGSGSRQRLLSRS